jgi:hypothetical protein
MALYVHTPESYGECTAVKWTGDNIEELRETFPDTEFEEKRGKLACHNETLYVGCPDIPVGDYIVLFEDMGVKWINGEFFEKNHKLNYGRVLKFNKKLQEDLMSPPNEIERPWLRRTALIISAPFFFVFMGVISSVLWTRQLFEDCW